MPIAVEGVSAETPRVYHHALSASHTDALLHEIGGVYNTTVNDALLTAVALAFATLTEQAALELTVEGHGREEDLLPDADLSRSVGWFTSQFPLRLQLPDRAVGRALKAVKEQLRHLPDSGIGYGPLRYLRPDSPLAATPQPQVLFNYLGHFERALPDSDLFSLAKPLQASSDARNQRTHAIDIAAFIQNGQLQMDWTLVESAISAEIAPQLAAETMRQLEAMIDHCLSAETTERTRSDFDLLDLDSDQFDQLSDLLGSLDA